MAQPIPLRERMGHRLAHLSGAGFWPEGWGFSSPGFALLEIEFIDDSPLVTRSFLAGTPTERSKPHPTLAGRMGHPPGFKPRTPPRPQELEPKEE